MLDQLKKVLATVLPDVDVATITEETRLVDDLGFDSLAMMMILRRLSKCTLQVSLAQSREM